MISRMKTKMSNLKSAGFRIVILAALLSIPPLTEGADMAEKGKYVLHATGGCSCHTDPNDPQAIMAGNRPLKTPFGPVYTSNITPDAETGIGNWSELDFINAMTKGVRPDGSHLFPVFPYTSFTKMQTDDLKALFAYLKTIAPVERETKPDDMYPPFGWRFGLFFWKLVNFSPGSYQFDQRKSEEWNRGAYLVSGLAHCAECHSPRNITGAVKQNLLFAGTKEGPELELAPNITPDRETGIGSWSQKDLNWFLTSGQKPDGDYTEGVMAEVIDEGYQFLSEADINAMSGYIFSLKPIKNKLD